MADANAMMTGIDTGLASHVGSSALNISGGSPIAIRDPLDTAQSVVGLQKGLVDLETVKLGLAAKKKAGDIMALAPDLDHGLAAMLQTPEVAGFAPEIISTLQAVSSSQTTQAGERQVQANSGLSLVMDGLLPAVNDPGMFDSLVASRMHILSPSAKTSVEAAMPGLKAALFDGLDKLSPEDAAAEYKQRLSAMMVGSGFSGEGIRQVTGTLAPQQVQYVDKEGRTHSAIVGGPVVGDTQLNDISAGPSTAEQTQLAAEGALASGIETDLSAAAADMPKILTNMDHMIEALSQIQTGGGADIRTNLGKSLQFFKNAGVQGITDEMINGVANGDLAATQTLAALMRSFVTDQMKQSTLGTGAGQVAAEVQAFLDSADITTDPQALLNLFQVARQKLQIDYDRAAKYSEFKQLLGKPGPEGDLARQFGPQGYYQWYNANEFRQDLLPKETPAGTTLASPTTKEELRGGTAGGAKKKSLDEIFGAP